MESVTPEAVKAARARAGMTQGQAGAVLGRSWRTWQNWELGDRNMRPELMDLFKLKVRAKLQSKKKRRSVRS